MGMTIAIPETARLNITWDWTGTADGYPAAAGHNVMVPFAPVPTDSTFVVYMFLRDIAGAQAAASIAANATPGSTTYRFFTRWGQGPARLPGLYEWHIRAHNLNYVRTEILAEGRIEILPAIGLQYDSRGPYRKALDALEAQIAAGLTWDKVSVSYGGRMVTFRSATELREALGLLKSQVQIEEARRVGKALPRDVRVRF